MLLESLNNITSCPNEVQAQNTEKLPNSFIINDNYSVNKRRVKQEVLLEEFNLNSDSCKLNFYPPKSNKEKQALTTEMERQ